MAIEKKPLTKEERTKLIADVDEDLALLNILHNSLDTKKIKDMTKEELDAFLRNIDSDIKLIEEFNRSTMTMEELVKEK